jgi:hypothetical protein
MAPNGAPAQVGVVGLDALGSIEQERSQADYANVRISGKRNSLKKEKKRVGV